MNKAKPFVKWVGGKRAIMESLKKYIPKEYNTYYEVFVGGGALLLELSPQKAVISDYNTELINVYRCLKNKRKLALILGSPVTVKFFTRATEEYYNCIVKIL